MKGTFELVTALHWGAVLFYVVATVMAAYGILFENPKLEKMARIPAALGLLPHGAGLLIWWRMVGHGPYMDRFEVLSSNAWVVLALFLLAVRLYPRISTASMVIFPATFIMVALGIFFHPEIRNIPASYRGYWLVLHIIFYKIAFFSVLVTFTFSIFYLLGTGGRNVRVRFFPEPEVMDLYAYRFAGFGFTFWAIGMLAGSIWAYQSLNSFWSWEPVQVWALVTWIMFGLYLHMRRFFGWAGRKAAWLYTICFALVVFSLFITPYLKSSLHSEYFK